MRKALIIIDMQNDFMPGGALAVPEGDKIVGKINQLQSYFDVVIATQDWHPPNHCGFASQHPDKTLGQTILWQGLKQILWPTHCVQHTFGAELISSLATTAIKKIIYKGTDADVDSYSAFFDNAHKHETDLHQYLKSQNIKEIYFVGVATEYCVKYSVLDACELGYRTYVVHDACRGINAVSEDVTQAFLKMQAAGAQLITSTGIYADSSLVKNY